MVNIFWTNTERIAHFSCISFPVFRLIYRVLRAWVSLKWRLNRLHYRRFHHKMTCYVWLWKIFKSNMCSRFLEIILNPMHNNTVQPYCYMNSSRHHYRLAAAIHNCIYIYHIGPVMVNDDMQTSTPPQKWPNFFFVP